MSNLPEILATSSIFFSVANWPPDSRNPDGGRDHHMESALKAASNERRRRNGKIASCEPCRKGKIRCDHQLPVCRRCIHRGIQAQCYVHAAPMTSSKFSLYRSHWETEATSGAAVQTPASSDRSPASPSNVKRTQPALECAQANAQITSAQALNDDVRIQQIAAVILQLLANHDFIRSNLEEYHGLALASLIPGRFTLGFLDSLPSLFTAWSVDNTSQGQIGARKLANQILQSTAAGWTPTASTTVSELIAANSGNNTRLQTLGLICNIAGRAMVYSSSREDARQDTFVQTMLQLGTWCLSISREVVPEVDDLLIWQAHEHVHLLKAWKGDWYASVWPQTGQLISDAYTLGLHREQKVESDAPFFLVELRRRCFSMIYHIDKTVSSWHEAPVRMFRHHSDTKMPLDLHDTELLAGGARLEEFCARLSPDGWNYEGNYQASAWARMRYVLGPIREQVSECTYLPKPLSHEHRQKLKDLSAWGRRAWESLPVHLRYTKSCWTSGLSPSICNMLALVYFNYLILEFQIQRMLEFGDNLAESSLLKISVDIIATILQLGTVRDRAVVLRHDYQFVLLTYGVPSAAVVTSMLAGSVRSKAKPLPSGTSRAEIIRQLSVVVSQLDTIFVPDNPNYEIASQASATITRILDEVLELPSCEPSAANATQFPLTPAHSSGPSIQERDLAAFSGTNNEAGLLGAADPFLGSYDEQGFNDWMSSIDWTAAGSEWSHL